MTPSTQLIHEQVMNLPATDRREVLLLTLENSGEEFACEILHALESARRAEELISGGVTPLTRQEAFARARQAIPFM